MLMDSPAKTISNRMRAILSRSKVSIALSTLMILSWASPSHAGLFSQIPDPFVSELNVGARAADSQFDTGAILPLLPDYATVYDNFSFDTLSTVTNLSWVGAYELDGIGDVLASSFTVSVYADDPGGAFGSEPAAAPIYSETFSPGALGETQVTAGGDLFRAYSADITPFNVQADETYWFSAVATVDFADNSWGMAFSDIGDDLSFQDFQDDDMVAALTRFEDPFDYAFSVTATPVPEPSSLALVGLTMLAGFRRRRRVS